MSLLANGALRARTGRIVSQAGVARTCADSGRSVRLQRRSGRTPARVRRKTVRLDLTRGGAAMAGILMGAYAALTYVFFFLTFLYAIAFVDDLPFAPKTLDSGVQGPLLPTLVVDALLLGLFAVQHSLMARPAFKRWWTKLVAPPIERTTYVLFASAALVVLYVFWRPLLQPIWTVAPGAAATGLLALSLVGWA